MLGFFEVRTDLAVEAKENLDKSGEERNGISVREERDPEREIYTTTVKIETENSAKAIGKPIGCYITMEVPDMGSEDDGYHRSISESLAEKVRRIRKRKKGSVLIVGLGNRNVTPDALGPLVMDNLKITRHLAKEFGLLEEGQTQVSALVPGVMAQTGMESMEIIRGVVEKTRPDTVIVVDALAARSMKRLNRTIQISDAGIHPGSGVGNHRCRLNQETLGVPVIAIGVPTVVDAATIVYDAIEQTALEEDQIQYFREKMAPGLNTMFVTPKDIDETVKRVSYTISEALNMAFSSQNDDFVS